MKYIPHLLIITGFIMAISAAPARTMRFSFSLPKQQEKISPAFAPQPQPIIQMPVKLPPVTVSVPPISAKPKPQIIATAAQASTSLSVAPPSPPQLSQAAITGIPIDLRSVVAVKCLFKNSAGGQVTAYGSGVVINAEGYVLTARHVVDMPYTYRITGGKQGFTNYVLDSCRIAVPPDSVKTPTADEIRTLNPFTPVTEFAYGAQLAFVPPEPSALGMSEGEYDFADSALLRITSAVSGALPHSFVASPVKITELPAQGSEVMSFGFPSGVPSYGSNFYLQGSVGEIRDIVGGDAFFKNQPVGMTAVMETIGGRSGSPVFWHGYVVGVISSKEDYSRNTAITAVFPIARFAEEVGIAVFK